MSLLSSASCVAQRMSAHTLRLIQPSMGVASASIVEPVLQLLRNLNLDVQHEGGDSLGADGGLKYSIIIVLIAAKVNYISATDS